MEVDSGLYGEAVPVVSLFPKGRFILDNITRQHGAVAINLHGYDSELDLLGRQGDF